MHSLWCCGPRQGRLKKSSFTSIFKPSRKNPVVNTSDSQISRAGFNSEQTSPFGGPFELCQMSDFRADTEEARLSTTLTNTNTFDGIKTRMAKHFSHEGSSRRHSRVSIGHSDEELARRAEVRRLRQKRIQDELQRDGEEDVPSVISNHSTRQLASLADLSNPRSGPRDIIEFTVDNCAIASTSSQDSESLSSQTSQAHIASSSPVIESGNAGLGMEHDVPSGNGTFRDPLPERKRTSMVSASSRPSSCEPGSSRMERVLGLESEFNIRHGSHAWDDQSALGVWLIAQGMKLNDTSAPQLEQGTHAGPHPVAHPSSTTNDIGAVDSIMESSLSISDGASSAKSPRLADVEQGDLGHGSSDAGGYGTNHLPCQESDAAAAGRAKAKGSSNYPSVIPSVTSSLSSKNEDGYVLSQQDIENLELSPIRWYRRLPTWKGLGHSEGKSSYTTAEEKIFSSSADDGDMPELLGAYITTLDTPEKRPRSRAALNLNKPLPAIISSTGHKTGQSGVDCLEGSQGTPKRTSLKAKLQKSLSGLSRLGDNRTIDT